MIKWIAAIVLGAFLCGCGGSQAKPSTSDGELEELTPQKRNRVRHSLIETLLASKAYDSATPLINRALRESPKDARLHAYRATVLRERGRLEQAQAVYQTALDLEPGLASAHAGIGIVLNMLGKHEPATQAHRKATELVKGQSAWLNNLGFSLYLEGKYPEAVVVFEQAIQADSRLSLAYVNLGFALAAQNKTKQAKRAFGQVLGDAEILNNLALAKELSGDPKAARELYEKAIITDPKNTDAPANLKAMDSPSTPTEKVK